MKPISNIKIRKEVGLDNAKNWARRHGYRVTFVEEAGQEYIFWQSQPEYFEGGVEQPITDKITVTIAETFRHPLMEGGWDMGIGGKDLNIPSNPANRATPPGDIHNYKGGKPMEDMMKSDVDVKHKDLKGEIDELQKKIMQLAKDKKPFKLVSEQNDVLPDKDYFGIEDAKLSPSAGYPDVQGGDEYNQQDDKVKVEGGYTFCDQCKALLKPKQNVNTTDDEQLCDRCKNKGKKETVIFEAGLNTYYD